MIRGRTGDTTGRPYVEGYLALPQQAGNPWVLCSFIVDTGAEKTVLMPVDARRMGLVRTRLSQRTSTLGVGGVAEGYEEFAFVVLKDEEQAKLFNFRITVFIPDETPDTLEVDASILGRDVLDHCVLTFDGPNKTVSLEVVDCSEVFPA